MMADSWLHSRTQSRDRAIRGKIARQLSRYGENQPLPGGGLKKWARPPEPRPLTRARGSLASASDIDHTRAQMAGSSLKRVRKQGVRLDDGSIVAFPYMPRVADLPPGWRHFTTAQKIEHLIGLDRCEEILSWAPITDLDPVRLTFQMQVIRVFLRIGLKAVLDGTLAREATRGRNRERVLEELTRREFGAGAGG